jgi:hypothetical protein
VTQTIRALEITPRPPARALVLRAAREAAHDSSALREEPAPYRASAKSNPS